jgi:hypothetical protein
VSTTFLYTNPDAKTTVSKAIREQRRTVLAEADDAREATWRERALSAEDALKVAHTEIGAQRSRIGELLGRIRDLEAEWTQDAVQRITTENATLKQRVRQLSTDNRTLDERLTAARFNLRFQDRRIADLEARLTEPASPTSAPILNPKRPKSARSSYARPLTGVSPDTNDGTPASGAGGRRGQPPRGGRAPRCVGASLSRRAGPCLRNGSA